jgi:hypothetical protein
MGVIHGSEAVCEGGVGDPLLLELALAPLMPVAPLRAGPDYVANVGFVRSVSLFGERLMH